MHTKLPFKRVLLKISGEMLMGPSGFGIDLKACLAVARQICALKKLGVEIAIVVGGGNIFRGVNLSAIQMPRTPADQMGMLATLMNGIALQQSLQFCGNKTHLMTALECPKVAESYNWAKAMEYISEGSILIFVGGTGNPFFTTDTAAALRASEIQADMLLKATKVDGIYNKDPMKHANAIKYSTLSYSQMLAEKLEVMDATAVALCQSNHIPIFVFNMKRLQDSQLELVFQDLGHGTLVKEV